MIVSNLQNSQRIEGLHPLFKSLFDYVKTHDLLHADLGRIEVDGDHLFINNVNPECVTSDQQVLELHHDYIDVHILLEGEEMIGWKKIVLCIQIVLLPMLVCFRGSLWLYIRKILMHRLLVVVKYVNW